MEAEFLSSLGFRTVSGNCSRMHTLSKVRPAADLWAVVCVDVCVHVCAFMCAQSGHAFLRDRNNKAACLYLDNGTHSRMGSIIQNKDLLSMFKRSCCIFRKRSSLLTFHVYSLHAVGVLHPYCDLGQEPMGESRDVAPIQAPGVAPRIDLPSPCCPLATSPGLSLTFEATTSQVVRTKYAENSMSLTGRIR